MIPSVNAILRVLDKKILIHDLDTIFNYNHEMFRSAQIHELYFEYLIYIGSNSQMAAVFMYLWNYIDKTVLNFMYKYIVYVNFWQIIVNIRFSCFLIEWRQILHKKCPLEIKEVHQWDPKKCSQNYIIQPLNLFPLELLTTNKKNMLFKIVQKRLHPFNHSPSKYDIKSDHIIFFWPLFINLPCVNIVVVI